MRSLCRLIPWWSIVLAAMQFISASLTAPSRAQDSTVATPSTAEETSQRPTVVVVIGAAGTAEYDVMFREWAARWQSAAQQGQATCITIGAPASDEDARTNTEMTTDRDRLRSAIAQWEERSRDRASQRARLWIVLLGHGAFDGKSARFNLQGPDISSSELAEWLSAVRGPVAVVNCSSSSGPFVSDLSAPERIIVTATKAGAERNFSRFGDFLSAALLDRKSDLDKDDQVSLWEAYVVGGARLREYYEQAGRLATEHPLLDDNGDRQGTPADWFRGLKSTRSAKDAKKVDGLVARTAVLTPSVADNLLSPVQRTQRDALEQQLESLKSRKMELDETEYYNKLEHILVELARLYREQPNKLSQ